MTPFIRQHMILSLAFLIAGLVTLFFLVRFATSTMVWTDPALQNQKIAGWMTPRYVTRSWQVAPEVVSSGLGVEMDGSGRRLTLTEIAAAQGRSVDDLIAELEAAIAAAQDVSND